LTLANKLKKKPANNTWLAHIGDYTFRIPFVSGFSEANRHEYHIARLDPPLS
jgi:hypothetical protein